MQMYQHLKKTPYYLVGLILLIAGCQPSSQSSETSQVNQTTSIRSESQECPTTPSGSLTNPEAINIEGQTVQKSGRVRSNDDIGFVFTGNQGQKLNYRYTDDICVWIYAPDNTLLSGVELPVDGNYTVHIQSLKGATSYEISLELIDDRAEILDTVQEYLAAKGDIFGPPFNRDLVQKFMTGKRYSRALGSIDWLTSNDAYYTYDVARLDKTWDFSVNGDTATFYATITQDLTLRVDGRIDPDNTTDGSKARDYYFEMEKVGDTWKISQIDNLF